MATAPLTVVIGAGISGLTAAYALKKSGLPVLLLEKSAQPGGMIQSVSENGFLYELGPQSFSATEGLYQLCDDLGIAGQLVEAPRGVPRYVFINGKLVPVPLSPGSFISSPLLSWNTKFSLLRDLFQTTVPPPDDESIATFVRRKFTTELLDRLVGPFVSGIYAGDPEQLSLRAAFPKLYEAEKANGSLIRGSLRDAKNKSVTAPRRRPGLFSFQHGTATLIHALANGLGESLRYNAEVITPIQGDTNSFILNIGSERLLAATLILATPTSSSAKLLESLSAPAAQALRDISYAPVAVVSHGYRKNQIVADLRGFGFLIPRSANIQTLGAVWNSSLFPNRAPTDHVLVTSFIGGACQSAAQRSSPQESVETVRRDTAAILRISGDPVAEKVTPYSAAIPQFNLGHAQRLASIRSSLQNVPGLWLTGNYWQGPAVGSCLDHALSVAEQVRISYNS